MEPTPELIDALWRDKVRAAKEMTEEQRLMAGPELFDIGCELMRTGIRMQHPDADPEQVEQMVLERLAIGERMEQRQIQQRRMEQQ